MNDIQTYKHPRFNAIRVVQRNGEPWFVGKDVAIALGYKDTVNALKDHVDDEDKGGWRITTPSGEQNMTIVNESGMYSLIFASKLPTARAFKRWVTSEVLPAIRKTGMYTPNRKNGKTSRRGLTYTDYTKIPQALRAVRKDLHMTRTDLAKLCGVSPSAISCWEIGRRAPWPESKEKLLCVARFVSDASRKLIEEALTERDATAVTIRLNEPELDEPEHDQQLELDLDFECERETDKLSLADTSIMSMLQHIQSLDCKSADEKKSPSQHDRRDGRAGKALLNLYLSGGILP